MSNSHDLADPCDYPWFRELGEIKDGVVRICVRKHPDLPYVWIRVRYADYVHRVSSWLNYVKQYWIQQFEMNMTKPSLAPVPTAIAAAAGFSDGTWVLAAVFSCGFISGNYSDVSDGSMCPFATSCHSRLNLMELSV